jgi:UDP-N-acetylglucosamine 3-dehydrogenase
MSETTRRDFVLGVGAAALLAQRSQAAGTIKLGIIGTGHRALQHLEALKLLPDYEVVALADPSPDFRDRAATAVPQAATYADYSKMLAERKDLDAVLVATPGSLHAAPAIAALGHGVHVICEKPMATKVEDANRMIEAARKAGKILQITMQSRYTPVDQKMHELVKAGEIGQVQYVCGSKFRSDWNMQSWKVPDPRTGKMVIWRFLNSYTGSSLLEDGIHQMDILHWIVGARPTRIYATGGNNVFKDRETIDHAGLLMDYENGVKFGFDFSILAGDGAARASSQMIVLGTDGMMQPEGGKVAIYRKSGPPKQVEVERGTDRARQDGTYRQYLAFADSIRTGKQPVCDGEAGKQAAKIGLLAEKSIRERKVVSWNDLPA